jgi:SlyX protein
MDEDSIIDLQSRIAHQEYTIAELNDALASQQSQISEMEAKIVALTDRVKALADAAPAAGTDDEPPPHY